jgi:hypothetical protein
MYNSHSYRQIELFPSTLVNLLNTSLSNFESTEDKAYLMILMLRRKWMTQFVSTIVNKSSQVRTVKSFLKNSLQWLVPEFVSSQETRYLIELATLIVEDPSSSSSSSSSSNSSSSSSASNSSKLVRDMLLHESGLMDRILVKLLLMPMDDMLIKSSCPSSSPLFMSMEELELRGKFLLKLIPEQKSFSELLKGYDTHKFHWLLILELSGKHRQEAKRALYPVASLQLRHRDDEGDNNNNTGGGGGGGNDLLNDKESGMGGSYEVVEKEGLKHLSWFNKLWNFNKNPSSSSSGSASRTNDATNDIESGGSTTPALVDRTLAGSAGVLRMQRYFMVLLPPNTPHVVVSLQPAKPLPWKWIGLGTVVSVTAVIVVLKARRSK